MKTYKQLYQLFALLFVVFFSMQTSNAQTYEGQKAKEIHTSIEKVRVLEDEQVLKNIQFEKDQQPNLENLPAVLNEALSKNNRKSTNGLTLKVIKDKVDDLGFQQVKYQQYYQGIPIETAISKAQVKGGKVETVMGLLYQNIEVNTTPNIDEDGALKAAEEYFGEGTEKWNIAKKEAHKGHNHDMPEENILVVLKENNQDYLCWKMDLQTPIGLKRVYIQAHTGEIVKTSPLELNCYGASGCTNMYGSQSGGSTKKIGNNYILDNATCTNQTRVHVSDWNSDTFTQGSLKEYYDTNNSWCDNDLDKSAYQSFWLVNKVLDYFDTEHGRDSYDDNGANVTVYNEAMFLGQNNTGYYSYGQNASMSLTGGVMKIGRGLNANAASDDFNAIDVVGHEFVHAITGAEAQLKYEKESGALNESFSDILGLAFERWTENDSNTDWLMGEDLSIGAFRSFSNPNSYGQPDTYGGDYWYEQTNCTPHPTNDFCGVHYNSGVQNHWFYLLTEGGSGTNDNGATYSVSGIGLDKAVEITYRTLTEKLSSSSDYADARAGSIAAAIDIYNDPCAFEVQQVKNAWQAVGVGAAAPSCSQADLICQSQTVNKTTVVAGTTLYATVKVRNVGTASTGSYSRVGYYLSSDPYYSADDIGLYINEYVPTLGVNSISNEGQTLTIPSNTASGIWYIIYKADRSNLVSESNENNNVVYKQITVTPNITKPDLICQSQTVSKTSLEAGQTLYATVKVKNIGTASTGSYSRVGYYLSNDPYYSTNDVGLYINEYVPTLGINSTSNEGHTLTIPANTTPGTWYIVYKADRSSLVNESNENNNVVYKQITVVGTNPTPPTNYCTAQGNNSNYMWIEKFEVDNTWSMLSGNNGGYYFFDGPSTWNLSTGSHTMELTSGATSNYYVIFRVWIDFDRDGNFESNEELFTHGLYGAGTISNGFTVPANAQNGATRMRISMKYNSAPNACETFSYGEVEDYIITLSGGSGKSDNTIDEYALTEIDNNTMKLYPNHVENGSQVNIDFELIEDLTDEATIEVYNIQGQLVDVIETGILIKGKHQTQYRIDNLTTGMYFCQMRFGENAITQKLIVE